MDVADNAENHLDREGDKKEALVHANEARSILKTVWCSINALACSQA